MREWTQGIKHFSENGSYSGSVEHPTAHVGGDGKLHALHTAVAVRFCLTHASLVAFAEITRVHVDETLCDESHRELCLPILLSHSVEE